MKLILDFQNNNTINFTTDDDPENNFYCLGWRGDGMYSLWYNKQFVWEKHYPDTGTAVANVTAALVEAMKKVEA